MDAKTTSEKHESNSKRYLEQVESEFTRPDPNGLYYPISQAHKKYSPVEVNATLTDQRTIPMRPIDSITNVIIAFANTLSAVIALGTLVGLIYTVRLANQQWTEMHSATVFSGQAARAAEDSAKAGKDAVEQSAAASRLDERPWISLGGVTCSQCSFDPGTVQQAISLHPSHIQTLTIQHGVIAPVVNSGKTPALRTRIEFFSIIQETNLANPVTPTWESVTNDWDTHERVSLGWLPPVVQQREKSRYGFSTHGSDFARTKMAPMSMAPQAPFGIYLMHDQKLPREFVTPLKKVIYIIGKITYSDSTTSANSTPPYATTFCIENLAWGPDTFTLCPSGNEMK
jgi:hypothetical protein